MGLPENSRGSFEAGIVPNQEFPGNWASQGYLEKSGEVTVSVINPLDAIERPDDN